MFRSIIMVLKFRCFCNELIRIGTVLLLTLCLDGCKKDAGSGRGEGGRGRVAAILGSRIESSTVFDKMQVSFVAFGDVHSEVILSMEPRDEEKLKSIIIGQSFMGRGMRGNDLAQALSSRLKRTIEVVASSQYKWDENGGQHSLWIVRSTEGHLFVFAQRSRVGKNGIK